MPILIVESGPSPGKRFTFESSVVVGRVLPADLVIDNPTVSRRHAMLRRVHSDCSVVDLGSINGTFVDGRRVVKPTPVDDGSLVQFGAVRVRYYEDERVSSRTGLPDTVGAITDDADRTYERQLAMPVSTSAVAAPLPPVDPTDDSDSMADLADRLQVLDEVARFSCKVLDQRAILEFVAEKLFTLLPHAERVVVLLKTPPSDDLVPIVGRARDGSLGHTRMSRTLLEDIVSRQEGVLVTDVPSASVGMSTSLDLMSIRSLLCVPVMFDGRIFGVIHADTSSFANRFDRRDLTLLLTLSNQVGMALAYTRLHADLLQRQSMEHDLEFAKRLQRHFLPQRLPSLPGYEMGVHMGVAEKLGGDFYDVLPIANNMFGVVVGDVCGKGIPAALYAAKLGSDVRYQAAGQSSPSAIMDRLNRVLTEYDHEGMFCTLTIAAVHVTSHRLLIANAGHPPPMLRAADGRVTKVGPTGEVPLGVDSGSMYVQREARPTPGDTMVFYSDGITEALNPAGEVYGEDRLMRVLERTAGTPDAMVAKILADVERWVDGAPQSDDQTLLCLKRRE